jgi:cytochrome c553
MDASMIWVVAGTILFGALATGVSQPASADSSQVLGRHLAQECTSCHRPDGVDNGIPSIVELDYDTFVSTFNFYRNGQRTNPAMVSVAQSLDDAQIRALARYFGSVKVEASNANAGDAGSVAPRR